MRALAILALLVPLLPAQDARPVIAAFGDSLTEGFGVRRGGAYPEQLQRALDAKGYKYRVVNAGVSGDTTGNALDRLSSVLALKPRIVIVEIGGNDGLRGMPPATTRANLDELVGRLTKSGARVLLWTMTLPPNYGASYIATFEKLFPEVAQKHRARLVPAKEEARAMLGDPKLMQRDGIHPTEEGYRRLLPRILAALEPELRRQ